MRCPACGQETPDGDEFCRSCGAPTAASPVQPPQQQGRVDPEATTPFEEGATKPLEQGATTPFEQAEDPLLVRVREQLTGDYEVQSELGRGGMAIVYRAVERELGRTVAIKVVPPDMAATGDTAKRFKREARVAASLDHPHIIPVYRVGEVGGLHYMAMKLVAGRALDEIVKEQGALSLPAVIKILRDAAAGLAFAHERGVIHRDIKGGNILVDTDGRIMVADFGIARAVGDATITATGMVVGTPSYMSPEQCSGQKLYPQSDQYSLGILGFQMITGSLPFEAESLMGVIQHHYMTPPPDMNAVRKGIPKELFSVITRLLEKSHANRFPTTLDLVDALEAVPQTEQERREANRMIRQLSGGKTVPKVRTKDLPSRDLPSFETPMAGQPAGARIARPSRRRTASVVTAAIGVVAIGGGVVAWQQGLFAPTPAPPVPAVATVEQTPPPVVAAPVSVQLNFMALPSNATVTVDNVSWPGHSGTVRPGLHSYIVTAAGYTSVTDTFTVGESDQTLRLAMTRVAQPTRRATPPPPQRAQPAAPTETGRFLVRANVRTAVVLLDGQRITNGQEIDVPVGRHTISVSAPGYVPFDTTVTVNTITPVRLPVTLVVSNEL